MNIPVFTAVASDFIVTKPFTKDTLRKLSLIAVDPGNTTGIAVAKLELHPGGYYPQKGLPTSTYRVYITTASTEWPTYSGALTFKALVKISTAVIWETFLLYPHKSQQQIGSQFIPVQVIGWLQGLALIHDKPTFNYPASTCKLITDEQLATWFTKEKLPKLVHERDALRVLMTYILKELS